MERKEFLTFPFMKPEIKREGDQGIIRGYASTFGNEDLGGDIVMPGAFTKTIRENPKIPILADHNPTTQIGVTTKAVEDNIGLNVDGVIDLAESKGGQPLNKKAAEKFSITKLALELGSAMGLSIGFRSIIEEFDRELEVRRLVEIKLFEWSVVTFPMNTMAGITATKGWRKLTLDNLIEDRIADARSHGHKDNEILKALERAAKTLIDPSEMSQSIEASLKQLNSVMKG